MLALRNAAMRRNCRCPQRELHPSPTRLCIPSCREGDVLAWIAYGDGCGILADLFQGPLFLHLDKCSLLLA